MSRRSGSSRKKKSGPDPATGPVSGEPRDTRARLIESALETFAEHGVEAVSIRTIVAAAGQGNQTAVHYHFGDKMGLVAAVLDQIGAWLAPMQQAALEQLERDPEPGRSVRALVELAFTPYITLFKTHPQGPTAIRFLTRLTWQSGGQGQSLLVGLMQPYITKFRDPLLRLLPGKPLDALALHMYLAVGNLIHGLSSVAVLGQRPGPNVEELYPGQQDRLLHYFYDYVAGGLSSMPPAAPG